MIRFGIVSRDQIPAALPTSRPLPAIAFTLLADINAELSDRDEAALALIYPALQAGSNSKRTFPRRYQAIDDAIAAEIDRAFPGDRPVRVHEMAASNAITSLELFERLSRRRNLSLHATDFYDHIHVVTVPGSGWRVVLDVENLPLQVVGEHMVIAAAGRERKRYPINWVIRAWLMATVVPKAVEILREAAAGDHRVARIALFHPRCIALAGTDSRFTLGRDSFYAPEPGFYEAIRIMGLGRKHEPDKIAARFRRVAEHIVDGGLFVIGFNRDHTDLQHIPTTIFQRQGHRFAAVRDLAGGYEHKAVILDLEIADSA